jgi:signal transduction histidine kinase
MNVPLSVLLFILPLLLTAHVGRRLWTDHIDKPGALSLLVMMLSVIVWLIGDVIEYNTPSTVIYDTVALQIEFTATSICVLFLLKFSVEYSTAYELSVLQTYILYAIAAGFTVSAWTNPLHSLFWTHRTEIIEFGLQYSDVEAGLIGEAHTWYTYTLTVCSMLLFLNLLFRDERTISKQSLIIAGAILCPTVVNSVELVGLTRLNLSASSLGISSALLWYGLYDTAFYSVSPSVRIRGWADLTDDIENGLVVTDLETTVVEINEPACRILGTTREEAVGSSLSRFLEAFEWSSGHVNELHRNGATYQGKFDSFQDSSSEEIGYTFSLTDITEQKQQQERLRVLNRVLRHNLRNELSPVMIHTDMIRSGLDDIESEKASQLRESADALSEQVETLEHIGTTARTLEESFNQDEVVTRQVDDVLTESIRSVREKYPNAAITVEEATEAATSISIVPQFEEGLTEILCNVFEHNDRSSVEARVAVQASADTVTIEIADNGRGISTYELDAFREKSESDFQHGSGLGLWLAEWTSRLSDGTMDVRSSQTGTTVTFELPAR